MKHITGIIVSYNKWQMLKDCMDSIRVFYPKMPLVIVDGSPKGSVCYNRLKYYTDNHSIIMRLGKNIGHGEGMKIGIDKAKTNLIALIDSDTIMKAPILRSMEVKMDENTFGVGKVITVDEKGMNSLEGIEYLHPYFCLINKELYRKCEPIIHHGAPMINTMISIAKMNKYKLIDYNLDNKIIHLGRGTRMLNPKEFKPATWSKVQS